MTDLIILAGTRDAVPDDLLSAHIRHARGGTRLLVVNEGGLAPFHADRSRDLVIDPARGNWDIRADCRDEFECVCVAEAMIDLPSPFFSKIATRKLTDALLDVLEKPEADLGQLSAAVRAMTMASLDLPSNLVDPEDRLALTFLAVLKAHAGCFPDRDHRLPLTSFRQWYDNPDGRILYLVSARGDLVATAVKRAILMLARGLTVAEPDHARIEFRTASERDADLAA